MTRIEQVIYNISDTRAPIIDEDCISGGFAKIDLSVNNRDLEEFEISDHEQCQDYIDLILKKENALLAIGGYLEKRSLYDHSPNFSHSTQENRNIHLGIDIWAAAGTTVLTPLDGIIHSFADNSGRGNYGPTLILEHNYGDLKFFTLYGHLSRASLSRFRQHMRINRGNSLAEIGTPSENGQYAPHLHFQLIVDLEGYQGDYPGVCNESTLDHYKNNCPNPDLLLKILG